MPQAAIFDIDGTLVDSVDFHAKAWLEAFTHFGYDVDFDQIKQKIGKGGDLLLQDILSKQDFEEIGESISAYREHHFHQNYVDRVQPFPQVRELFEQLRHDNIAIVLATSAEQKLANHYEKMLDVGDLIEGIVCAGDVDKAKPNPAVFEVALKQFDATFEPSQVVVVGDSPYDAEAASQIDLATIGLLSGGFAEDTLRDAGCTAVYGDIADLLKNYDRSFRGSVISMPA